jgi:signal transduction histidine kinase
MLGHLLSGAHVTLGVVNNPERRASPSVVDAYAELLSLAVHEFRTPASVVGGYLRMLLRDTEAQLSERQTKMVTEADKACARLVGLIAELSEIAKLDAGTAAGKDETFDLFQVVEELADGVHEADNREVHLHIRGDAAGAVMRGDLPRIRAAFASFFRAVLREQPTASRVAADRRRVHNHGAFSALIVIAPEQDVQKAYESEPTAFDEKRGGLGLALPIARRVIERQGGRVWSPAARAGQDAAARAAIIVSLPVQEQNR